MEQFKFEILQKMHAHMREVTNLFGDYLAREAMQYIRAPKPFTLIGDDEPTKGKEMHALSASETKEDTEMKIDITGLSISKKPRKDGRYMGYVTIEGNRRYEYGRTQEEVARKLEQILKGEKKTNSKKKDALTVGAWIDKFVDLYKKDKVKPKTLESLSVYTRRIKREFGDRKLSAVNGIMVTEYIASLPSQAIKRRVYVILNEAFEKAFKGGLIKSNPCDIVDCPKQESAKKDAITREQFECIIEKIPGKKKDLIPLYRFLLATGLRIGEALALTPADFKDGVVSVNKNVVFINKQRIEQPPKTKASIRSVLIPKGSMPKIQSPIVFPFTYEQASTTWQKAAMDAGYSKVTLHSLRHTYATWLTEAGVPPKVKQKLLGHGSLNMTENVYTDVLPDYFKSFQTAIDTCFD